MESKRYWVISARQCGKNYVLDLVKAEKEAKRKPDPARLPEFLRPLYMALHGC